MSAARRRETLVGYLFIAPNLLSVICFMLIPLLYSLATSFFDYNMFLGFGGSSYVGLKNYIKLFSDEKVVISLLNNLKYILGVLPVTLILAMFLGVLLNDKIYMKNAARAIFFLPYITSVAAMSKVWMHIFSPTNGFINGLLKQIGVENPPTWLAGEKWVMPTLIIIGIWMNLGYDIVLYMSGLQGIDKCLYESAEIDGAGFWQKFRYIIVPLLTPTTFFLLITGIIGSFQIFGIINVLTKGGPGTSSYMIAYYTYQSAFVNFEMGYSSAMSWLFIGIIMIITVIQWIGQKKWVNY